MSTPTGYPQPGSPPALTQVSARFMAAPLQTKLQVAGRGGKHFLLKCLWQRRSRTLPPSRTVDKPQGRSISARFMCM